MEKIYFSVDVEAAGKDPQRFSMISLGSCLVGRINETFYQEIKPIDQDFQEKAMRIGCLGLHSLEQIGKDDWTYNPRYEVFDPAKVIRHLQQHGQQAAEVMNQFKKWVVEKADGRTPVFISTPVTFDYTFVTRYFSLYAVQNPFQEKQDPRALYEELIRTRDLSIEQLGLNTTELEPSHNALEDAILQARIFEKLLEFDGKK